MSKRDVNSYLGKVFLAGLALIGLGVLMADLSPDTPGQSRWPFVVAAGGVLAAVPLGVWWNRYTGTRGRVRTTARRSKRNDGVASVWDIRKHASRRAMRKKATVLRPSLADKNPIARAFTRTREYATPIAKVGAQTVWSPVEDVTYRSGGARVGKSGELGGRIIDAPGAVIATSTRTDLWELTRWLRERRGPVYVFNPSGLGGLTSTISFDPLDGCGQPKTANERAEDMLAAVSAPGSGDDRAFWSTQARRVLAALMHAAALGDLTMRDVLDWVAEPDRAEHEYDILRLLRRSPEPSYEIDALQFLRTNDRTRSSICATIMPALGWLTDETAVAATRRDASNPNNAAVFDVNRLLASRGTVYMLGAEDSQVAPLVAALTGFIAREARRIAALAPKGRLDPPLTLALDEAAIICPIPLDKWTADMGGRGVQIHIATQSRAQLRQRWGEDGAAVILNNTGTLLLFGGVTDDRDLKAFCTLIGDRDEKIATHDGDGRLTSVTYRKTPVLSEAQLRSLPPGRVVILRRGMPAAIGRVRMAWKRADVRYEAARRRINEWLAGRATRREAERVLADLFADDQPPSVGSVTAAGAGSETRLRLVDPPTDPDNREEGNQ